MLKKSIIRTFLFLFIVLISTTYVKANNNQALQLASQVSSIQNTQDYQEVLPVTLVEQPTKYFHQKVKLNAKFDKFTAIGLDYPPVNRDAKNYISFLIKRDNITSYNIPLSELKLIVKRDYAEKELINVEQGDSMIIYGTVFSMALGDPWIDVEKITLITTHKNKKASN